METGYSTQDELFRFAGVRVRDIFTIDDVVIRRGRTTVLRGPSGCGKTTALRLLNRMTPADEGELLHDRHPIDSFDAVTLRRRIVMLAQQPVLFADSVQENLRAGCRFAHLPEPDEEAMRSALDAVHLRAGLDTNPISFSGGEKQRLALARVLLMDPPVLLLDEPSSGLDVDTEQAVFAVIRNRRDSGRSAIIATHARDLERLGELDLLVFRDGRLQGKRTA